MGRIGLIKAIDRFDLDRGVELTTYATPNIIGEIKRYFRDKGWAVRVPRGLQELNIRLNRVMESADGGTAALADHQRAGGGHRGQRRGGGRGARERPGLQLGVHLLRRGSGRGEDRWACSTASGGEEEAYEMMEHRRVLAPAWRSSTRASGSSSTCASSKA